MHTMVFAAMRFAFSPETVPSSLRMMAEGMLGIFAVIVVLWLFVAALGKLTCKKDAK